jgi:uncharacterized protein (TIGR02611 family)
VNTVQRSGRQIWSLVRRILVAVIGGTILIAGIVLCFIPGPGLLLILLGLSILATEFIWAREARAWLQRKVRAVRRRIEMTRRPPERQLQ